MAKRNIHKPVPEDIGDYLAYNCETGQLFWIKKPEGSLKVVVGEEAGSFRQYVFIGFRGEYYYAHRIAWFIYYKTQPPPMLDHKNRNRWDNSILNLRESDPISNSHNSPCWNGFKGLP